MSNRRLARAKIAHSRQLAASLRVGPVKELARRITACWRACNLDCFEMQPECHSTKANTAKAPVGHLFSGSGR